VLKFILLIFLFPQALHAAVTSTTVWEWRQTATASEANGCGFDATTAAGTGTDWTQQNTAQYSLTSLTSSGAGNVILTSSASADMLGNVIHITAGTNFTLTHPWFLITAVSPGVSLTVTTNEAAASVTTGVGSAGTGTIGGACNFGNATLDANIWLDFQPGNTAWFKSSGSAYTMTASFAGGTFGTALLPITVSGYNAARGDNPTGTNRPTITFGSTFTWSVVTNVIVENFILSGAGTSVVQATASPAVFINDKITNTSTTAGRSAMAAAGQFYNAINCEIVSYRGIAASASSQIYLYGNYIHSSNIGVSGTGNSLTAIINNIFSDNVTGNITTSSAQTALFLVEGNTFYGAENKLGYGINLTNAGGGAIYSNNNIFYGLVNAIELAGANLNNLSASNNFFNNTTDVVNWTKSASDISLTPSFLNAQQVIGSAGVVSGSTLTDSSANFANVVNSQDFVYIISGTGATAGQYLITSHTGTVLTLNSAPGGSGTNIIYQVATGHNFAVGVNMKFRGFPSIYPGFLTTNYLDIGAAQRHEYGRPVNKK
jgi:hypothetical protein